MLGQLSIPNPLSQINHTIPLLNLTHFNCSHCLKIESPK